eukprot:1159328-Pelagomonas_calceolata.AAC.7
MQGKESRREDTLTKDTLASCNPHASLKTFQKNPHTPAHAYTHIQIHTPCPRGVLKQWPDVRQQAKAPRALLPSAYGAFAQQRLLQSQHQRHQPFADLLFHAASLVCSSYVGAAPLAPPPAAAAPLAAAAACPFSSGRAAAAPGPAAAFFASPLSGSLLPFLWVVLPAHLPLPPAADACACAPPAGHACWPTPPVLMCRARPCICHLL